MGIEIVNLIFVFLLLAGVMAAVGLFVKIQLILSDPGRKEFEKAWYAAFEHNVAQRYDDGEIEWRAKDLHEHWGPGPATPM